MPSSRHFSHVPTPTTIAWLALSLPVVIWDAGYVLGRPATMPGGWAHRPLWTPYALYGEVDYMYGIKQYQAGNGFVAAQVTLNLVETTLYAAYLAMWWRNDGMAVAGRRGAVMLLIGLAAAIMTLSKTGLYCLNEVFSGFDNVGHNSFTRLLFLWIIPNGAWLVFPTLMVRQFSSEIVDGLAGGTEKTE